ncbi:WD repeat-containing protein 76-like isoform X1 [Oculina patagonica]
MPKTRRDLSSPESSTPKKLKVVLESSTQEKNAVKLEDSDVKENAHGSKQMSDYERMRLENIKRNNEFFAGLNLSQAKLELNLAMSSPRTTKVKERGLSRPKKTPPAGPALPTRQSLRLRNKDPDGVALPDPPQEMYQSVDEHRTFRYFPRPVKAVGLKNISSVVASQTFTASPRKVGPLEMKPCNNIDETQTQEFIDELTVLANILHKSKEKVGNAVKDMNVESYKNCLGRLKIKDGNVAKLVPHRIFSMAFHPAKYKTLVVAGDKWGNLGIWNVGSSKGDDGVYLFEPHSRPINCLSFDPDNCAKLYTCSYDGTLRCCDFNSSTFQEVYSFDEDDYSRFMYFAFGSPSSSTILAAIDTGYVLVVDTRTKRNAIAEQSYCLHDKVIKCIDVHPLNRNIFLTSSTDGSVAFWDIRNVKNMKSKLSSLQRTRVAPSAYFSPLTGSQVLVTSQDDYVTINDVDSSGIVSTAARCCFRHDNQTGRWLTNFRAMWDPKFDKYAVVGSMRRPRQIDIFSSEQKSTALMHLTHENLNSINSLNVFHPSVNMLAGGNSSGKVYLWTE